VLSAYDFVGKGMNDVTRKLMFVVAILAGAASVAIGAAPTTLADPRYASCYEAHDDGQYSIPRDDPAYQAKQDFDGDGFACEAVEHKQ
jgi:hypothetical protein